MRHAAALNRLGEGTQHETEPNEEVIERLDALTAVREADKRLRELSLRERDVFALLVYGELTYEEAAEALSVPVGTIRSRMARARSRLALAVERSESPTQIPIHPARKGSTP